MSDILSYPTVAAFVFDIPEPESITGDFVYNYFVPDEMLVERGDYSEGTREVYIRHGRKLSRYIKLTYPPAQDAMTLGTSDSSIKLDRRSKYKIFRKGKKYRKSELSFMGRNFGVIMLQDPTAVNKLQSDIEAALRLKKVNTEKLSPLETLLKYSSVSSDKVNGQDLLDHTNVEGNNEYSYIDPATGKPFDVMKQGNVSDLAFACSLSKKFINDIVSRAEGAPLSPLRDQLSTMKKTTRKIQTAARQTLNSNNLDYMDYETSFIPIKTSYVNTRSNLTAGNQFIGYVINKWEVMPNGQLSNRPPIFIQSTESESFIDKKVAYGKTYRYAIQNLYLVKLQGPKSDRITQSEVLVTSRESPYYDVVCKEVVPPPPPGNLQFWRTQERKLMLEWEFPYTPQEDIKRFQIFRRKSIKEAFTLIAELDFDNSMIRVPRSEFIPDFSKIDLKSSTTLFIDEEFDVESVYIYAVCSVDAHDLSSPYSEQFEVYYDKALAKMRTKFISYGGSPKPYPNFNLVTTLTSDSIKDSLHDKLTVYFDPEYLVIKDSDGNNLDHLTKSRDIPSYKIQLINLDRQLSQLLNIYVQKI
jgi:hypothetical protein